MGALPDPVSVFIEPDIGSRFLHSLDKGECIPVDDGRVMIF
jgi:hypothetical protein